MIDIIKTLPQDKILVINIKDDNDRKLIHQYLETNMTTKKSSMCCDVFDRYTRVRFLKNCYHCNKKNVKLNNYNYGSMENNQDEYWSGQCPKCGENNYYEPNYDNCDNIHRSYENNCIVININYTVPNHAKINKEVTDNEFNLVISKYKYYIIDKPNDLKMKKEKLQDYISSKIKKLS